MVFLTRGLFIVPGESLPLPAILQRVLRYAPAATLVAIIAPDLGIASGHLALSADNVRLVAGLAGFAIAAATRSVLLTIAGGMLVLTGLRLALGLP